MSKPASPSATESAANAAPAYPNSTEWFRLVVETMNEAGAALDEHGIFTYANDKACELFGVPRQDLIGRDFADFLVEDGGAMPDSRMAPGCPAESGTYEVAIKTAGGILDVRVSAAPLLDGDGNVRGSFAVMTDVTALVKMHRMLAAAARQGRREDESEAGHQALEAWADIFERAGWGFAIAAGGSFTLMNPAYAELHGYSVDELVGKPIDTVVPPDWRERVPELIQRAQDEDHYVLEMPHLRKDGSEFPAQVDLVAIKDQEGSVLYRAVFVQDITQRKQAEDEVRRSEATNHALLDAIPDLMFRMNAGGTIIGYIPAKGQPTYVPPEDFLGKSVSEVMPPETSAKIMSLLGWAIESGEVQQFEHELLVEGRARHYEPRMVATGRDEVLAIVRDITERKEAEAALRQSEVQFRGLLEAAPDAMIIVDPDGLIKMVNTRAEEMFGLERDDLVGAPVEVLIPERFRDGHVTGLAGFKRSRRGRAKPLDLDLYARRKDGTEFPVDISLSTLETDEGLLVTAAVRDVTERKQLEERVRKTREEIESRVELRLRKGGAYGLTFREFTVLHHVGDGKTDKEIALELGISPLTVQKHVASILSKMNAVSRTEAGVRAIREGLLDELVPAASNRGRSVGPIDGSG